MTKELNEQIEEETKGFINRLGEIFGGIKVKRKNFYFYYFFKYYFSITLYNYL